MKKIIVIFIAGLFLTLFSSQQAFSGSDSSCSVDKGTCAASADSEKAAEGAAVRAVINKICPVMGGEIDPGTAFKVEYDGKTIGLCCAECVKAFNAEPEKYMKKVEEELSAAKAAEPAQTE